MVYLLPTESSILVWDKPDINLTEDMKHIPDPTWEIKNPFSFWKYRNLRKRSIIVGFIGPRGSGKSVGAARTVCLDFMLRGKTVWSNMDIGFNLIHGGKIIPVQSKPLEKLDLVGLDEVFENGVIYVDEVNLLAEARRAMSKENLMFSYILQQLRKRRLSIIWSAQSENHCDDRLRFQTDIFVLCQDVSLTVPACTVGAKSRWRAHDYSGVVKGRTYDNSDDNIFFSATMWNRPWWHLFDTYKVQEIGVGEKKKPEQEDAERIAGEIYQYMVSENMERIDKRFVRKHWKVKDMGMLVRIGQILSLEYEVTADKLTKEYVRADDCEMAVT